MVIKIGVFALSLLLSSANLYARSCPTPSTRPTVNDAYAAMASGSVWEAERPGVTIHMSFVSLGIDPGNQEAKRLYSNGSGVFKIGYNSSAGGWECRRHLELTGVRRGKFSGYLAVEACNPAFKAAPLAYILSEDGANHPDLAKLHYALTTDQLSKGADKIVFETYPDGALARFKIPMTDLQFEESSVGQGCRMVINMQQTQQKTDHSKGWYGRNSGYAGTSRYYTWDLSNDSVDEGYYVFFNQKGKQTKYTPR